MYVPLMIIYLSSFQPILSHLFQIYTFLYLIIIIIFITIQVRSMLTFCILHSGAATCQSSASEVWWLHL